MRSTVYCVEHAMDERLVVATSASDGRSTCGIHSTAASGEPTPIGQHRSTDQCSWCTAVTHRAYFIVGEESLCIRHAADAVFPLDDMGAHHMAHSAYLQLRDRGVSDAY